MCDCFDCSCCEFPVGEEISIYLRNDDDSCECCDFCEICEENLTNLNCLDDEYKIDNCDICNNYEYKSFVEDILDCECCKPCKFYKDSSKTYNLGNEFNNNNIMYKNEQKERRKFKKKDTLKFCNKEVTCLFRKQKYNISVLPLPVGFKTTEVIVKPVKMIPKNSNKIDPKNPKIKIAIPKTNKKSSNHRLKS